MTKLSVLVGLETLIDVFGDSKHAARALFGWITTYNNIVLSCLINTTYKQVFGI